MSRILNNSIQDNKNILRYLRIEIERYTIRVLVSQTVNEVNEIENELFSMRDSLRIMNNYNKNTLKRGIDFILSCIDLALVAVATARSLPFENN